MKKGMLFVSFLIIVSMLLAACGGGGGEEKIKVGLIAELTGDIPAVGASCKNAAEMAVKEINDAGGLEINGKKYWKKKQYIAQVLIVEDTLPADETTGEKHEGQVRYITLGYQLYNIIKEAFASEDDPLEEIPYNFDGGYDFIIKKTEQGNYASYTVGTKFLSKQRSLTEDELAVAEEGMIELSTLLPKNPGLEKVQAMLDADLNGGSYSENGSDEKPAAKPAPAARKPPPARWRRPLAWPRWEQAATTSAPAASATRAISATSPCMWPASRVSAAARPAPRSRDASSSRPAPGRAPRTSWS